MKANDESGDTPRTKGSPSWSKIGERGSTFWIRFILSGIRVLGSAPIRYLVPAIALYYCLFDRLPETRFPHLGYRLSEVLGRLPSRPNFRRAALRQVCPVVGCWRTL